MRHDSDTGERMSLSEKSRYCVYSGESVRCTMGDRCESESESDDSER
jgi:hypothetical protein